MQRKIKLKPIFFEGTLFVSDPEETNYYSLVLNVYNEYYSLTYQDFTCESPYIEGVIDGVNNFQMFFSDKLFNGKQISIQIISDNEFNVLPIDSVYVEVCLLSISEEYYKYASSYYNQVKSDKDFYAEPTDVFSNIDGGRGIFAAYSKSTIKTETIKGPFY